MKKRKLKWAAAARSDLKAIKQYIARDALLVATAYVRKIRERCLKLVSLPFAAPIVEEFQHEDIRETYYGSYRILYLVDDEAVTVLRVFHGARLLDAEHLDDSSNP